MDENQWYEVLKTEHGYNEGDKFIIHNMDGGRRWIEFDNGCPLWEDPEILKSLKVRPMKKGEI